MPSSVRASDSMYWQNLSMPRIAAVSATLTLHSVVFALLMVPVSLPERIDSPETITEVVFSEPPKPQVLTPVQVLKPVTTPTVAKPMQSRNTTSTITPSDTPAGEVTTDTATALDTQVTEAISQGVVGDAVGGDVDASTRAQFPIAYPISALREQATGVVWVWVSFDATGSVTEVRIHQSSRHRALDKAALQGVKRWKINPRQVQGQPLGGQSLVEVVFNL